MITPVSTLYHQFLQRLRRLGLLDNRITKRYGQTFLSSLPPYRTTQTITDVEAFFSQ
jgi:hypothetical protein